MFSCLNHIILFIEMYYYNKIKTDKPYLGTHMGISMTSSILSKYLHFNE